MTMKETPMELCGVYDESGVHTGRVVTRGTKLSETEYYLVVQVWIRNETREYLVQQRALNRVSDPGIWATTAGYVVAGEDSIFGAIREVNEELGIQLSQSHLKHFGRLIMDNLIQDIWIASVSKIGSGSPTLGSEVADSRWATKAELEQMVRRGDFFAYSYLDDLPE